MRWDSNTRRALIPCKLLILRIARLAGFAALAILLYKIVYSPSLFDGTKSTPIFDDSERVEGEASFDDHDVVIMESFSDSVFARSA